MDINLIMLIVILVGCLVAYLYFKQKGKKAGESSESLAEKTAQDFVNVRDVGENVLYTMDGRAFAYLKIDGFCLELFSENELLSTSQGLASRLSQIRFEWKFISVSRPIDLKSTLRLYSDLYATAEGGQRALLKQEMTELADMAISGDTLERQHYIILWSVEKDEKQLLKNAAELAAIFNESRTSAAILDKRGIVELCNLVNIPAYSHLENRFDFDGAILEAIIK